MTPTTTPEATMNIHEFRIPVQMVLESAEQNHEVNLTHTVTEWCVIDADGFPTTHTPHGLKYESAEEAHQDAERMRLYMPDYAPYVVLSRTVSPWEPMAGGIYTNNPKEDLTD